MAHYIIRNCPYCGERNSYDLEELRRKRGTIYRGPEEEEFRVTCHKCGRAFVVIVEGEYNDERR